MQARGSRHREVSPQAADFPWTAVQGVPEGVVSWGRMVVWRRGDSARLLYPGVIDAGSGPPEASVDVGAESEVAIQPRSLRGECFGRRGRSRGTVVQQRVSDQRGAPGRKHRAGTV